MRQPWIVLLLVLIGGISTLGMDLPCVEMCCSSVWTCCRVTSDITVVIVEQEGGQKCVVLDLGCLLSIDLYTSCFGWVDVDSHPLLDLFRCRLQQTLFVCRSHPPLS